MDHPIIHTMEQGSDEWFAARLGKVTASKFKVAMGKSGKTRDRYKYGLIEEIRKGKRRESYKSESMEFGTETEPSARDYYSKVFGCEVNQVGFIEFNDHIGVSPDGLIGDDGLLEIKCPITPTHIKYIDKDALPAEYKEQVYGQLWVTGRQWCDIISYDPTWKDQILWRLRVERDEKKIADVEVKVNKFVKEMNDLIDSMVNSKF